jgi:hypothetical protein
MGQLDEELLQRGFEAGMDAGMSDAEAVGAAQGILAALDSLPPALLPSYGGSGGSGASAPPGKPTDEAVHAAWASVREFGAAHADRSSVRATTSANLNHTTIGSNAPRSYAGVVGVFCSGRLRWR